MKNIAPIVTKHSPLDPSRQIGVGRVTRSGESVSYQEDKGLTEGNIDHIYVLDKFPKCPPTKYLKPRLTEEVVEAMEQAPRPATHDDNLG